MTVPPEEPAREETTRGEADGRTIRVDDGTRLRLRTWLPTGAADDVVGRIVLVHGLGDHAGRYEAFARGAVARGFAVLAYDQRGHGLSEGRRGVVRDFEELLADLDAVVAEARATLPGPDVLMILGHSLGGLVVLRFLQTRKPDLAGAVLSAPWLDTAADVPAWKRAAARVLERVAPALTLSGGVEAEALTRDPERQREYDDDPLVHDRVSAGLYRAVLDAQEAALADSPPRRIPLLGLVPLDDRLADSDVTRAYLEGLGGPVTVELLEDGRHEPLNDIDREAVCHTVLAWMEAHVTGEPPTGERVS